MKICDTALSCPMIFAPTGWEAIRHITEFAISHHLRKWGGRWRRDLTLVKQLVLKWSSGFCEEWSYVFGIRLLIHEIRGITQPGVSISLTASLFL